MTKIKNTVLLVLIVFSAHAQIPGYLGKRFVVGYSTYCMMGFKGPGALSSSPASEASPTFNNAHCLNVEYVFRTSKMICLSAQYIRTGVAYDDGSTNQGFFGDFFRSASETPYPGMHKYTGDYSVPASLRSFNIDIGYKKFKRGFLAPVGKYRKFDILMLFEKLTYDNTHFAVIDPSASFSNTYTKSTLGTGEYSYKNVAFAYTIGNQRMLGDRIILDYGIRFAYSPSLNIVSLASVADSYASDIESYFRRASNLRMDREQLVNIHLGIGFLAF